MIDYKCDRCAATGVKLWREYQTSRPRLLCGPCAMQEEHLSGELKPDGTRISELSGQITDQIGSFIPAVPDVEMEHFWGYTSVPDEGVIWWRELPITTKPD